MKPAKRLSLLEVHTLLLEKIKQYHDQFDVAHSNHTLTSNEESSQNKFTLQSAYLEYDIDSIFDAYRDDTLKSSPNFTAGFHNQGDTNLCVSFAINSTIRSAAKRFLLDIFPKEFQEETVIINNFFDSKIGEHIL